MHQSYKSLLQDTYDISIFNFQHLSGAYKASFSVIHSPNTGANRTIDIVVRQSETYKAAIARSIKI